MTYIKHSRFKNENLANKKGEIKRILFLFLRKLGEGGNCKYTLPKIN